MLFSRSIINYLLFILGRQGYCPKWETLDIDFYGLPHKHYPTPKYCQQTTSSSLLLTSSPQPTPHILRTYSNINFLSIFHSFQTQKLIPGATTALLNYLSNTITLLVFI